MWKSLREWYEEEVKGSDEGRAIDPRDFRNTLGRFTTGITVVTMLYQDRVYGITVNAFMSVSLKPPLVLVSIAKRAKAHATLMGSERYGVSILREGQEILSNHFAGRTVEGLEVPYRYVDGFPLIEGAVAHLICRIVDRRGAGDHTLFIGQVEHLAWEDARPLVYHAGRYGQFMHPERDPLLED